MQFLDAKHFLDFTDNCELRFPAAPRLVSGIETYKVPQGLGVFIRASGGDFVLRGRNIENVFDLIVNRLTFGLDKSLVFVDLPESVTAQEVANLLWILFQRSLIAETVDSKSAATNRQTSEDKFRRERWFFDRIIAKTDPLMAPDSLVKRIDHSAVLLVLDGIVGRLALDILIHQGFRHMNVFFVDHCETDCEAFSDCVLISETNAGSDPLSRIENNNVATAVALSAGACDLLACCGASITEDLVLKLNTLATKVNVPFLPGLIRGDEFSMGPFFDGGGSSCYNCDHLRRRAVNPIALEEELFNQFMAGNLSMSHCEDNRPRNYQYPELFSNSVAVASSFSSEIVRIITRYTSPRTISKKFIMNYISGDSRMAALPKVPGCTHCGSIISRSDRIERYS